MGTNASEQGDSAKCSHAFGRVSRNMAGVGSPWLGNGLATSCPPHVRRRRAELDKRMAPNTEAELC